MGLLVVVAPEVSDGQPGDQNRSVDQSGDQSFTRASRRGGPLHLVPLEAFEFPDRIRAIETIYVQGRGEGCVCVYVCSVCVCVWCQLQ